MMDISEGFLGLLTSIGHRHIAKNTISGLSLPSVSIHLEESQLREYLICSFQILNSLVFLILGNLFLQSAALNGCYAQPGVMGFTVSLRSYTFNAILIKTFRLGSHYFIQLKQYLVGLFLFQLCVLFNHVLHFSPMTDFVDASSSATCDIV